MRILVQRVSECTLRVDGKEISKIGKGLIVFLGVFEGDSFQSADYLIKKTSGLRVFEDEAGKMNLSVKDIGGSIMLVSQFTLCGSLKSGFRPSFSKAENPERANKIYEYFKQKLIELEIPTESGIFGADMKINYINDGPVSVVIDKDDN